MVPTPLHDRYEILRPLARGGMAMVHLAREVDTGREIALKQLVVPEGAKLAEWRLRFAQEFHTAARLKHPNVVETYDYAESRGGLPFFTMEYLPGPGLEEAIPLHRSQVAAWLPGLLQGLAYMHRQGFVHGDLKPENIRLGADGQLRLMDLGLVTRVGQPTAGVQGTLPYLAPEIIRRAPTDRRSDLYALGAVLFHLLAGRPPFQGDNREVLVGHLEGEPPDIAALVPGLPPELAAVIMKLLAKDPLQRFSSADDVLRALAGGTGAAGEDDQTLFHPPLIGRVKELRELAAGLNRAKAGAYEEVWLQGNQDAGLGSLLDEFCCRAQLLGASVLRGTFRPRMAPLEGLRGVARGLVALARPHAAEVAHLLPTLARIAPELGQPGIHAPAPDADPQQELLRVFEALTQVLRLACDSGPLLLAFGDTHLADARWREWLEYVRRNAPQLPVLVASTFVGDVTMELDLDLDRTTVEVGPLELAQTRETVCATLGQADLSDDFVARVQAASAGWPARVDLLLRRLAGAGVLLRREGAWVLPDGDLAPFLVAPEPQGEAEGFQDLAVALLDALIVLGREAELLPLWNVARLLLGGAPGALEEPDPAQSGELFEALRGLEEKRWVEGAEGVYRLGAEHDRAQALAGLSPQRLVEVHGAIAAVLEAQLAADGDLGVQIELASHAMAAGDADGGPRHALSAARGLARMFSLEAAEELLAEALPLVEAAPKRNQALRLGLLWLRADVARLAGDRRRAAALYPEALGLAKELDDALAEAGLSNGYGRFMLATGHPQEAEALFQAALARVDAGEAEAALAQTMLGRCALVQGDLASASIWVERALSAARHGGFRSLIRENMAQLGYLYVAGAGDRAGEGLSLLFDAIQLIEKDEAKLELNACYALLGNAQLLLGRFTEARLAFQRNCDLCAEVGAAPHDEATAYMRLAQVALEVGDYRGARKAVAPAGALAKMVGDKLLLAQVRLIEGLAALYQGDFTIYQDAMALVEDRVKASGSVALEAMALTCRAEAEGFLGATSAALSSAGAALALMAQGTGHEYRERALLVKADALTRMGLYKPALIALEELGTPRGDALHARALLARAHHERLSGKPMVALHLAQRCLELARRGGVVPVAAACCMLLSKVCPRPEEALDWSRKALLDAEVCGQPALEAEALYQASRVATSPAQVEWFMTSAADRWRVAVAGLTPASQDVFGTTEDRRPLRDAVRARAAEGYRLTREDHELVLAILSRPPAPAELFRAIAELCRETARADRVALFWEDAAGHPQQVDAVGHPYAGATIPAQELELAAEAPMGVLLMPLQALAATEPAREPWGALLVAGLAPDCQERLEKLLAPLGGALWAARALWLQARAAGHTLV